MHRARTVGHSLSISINCKTMRSCWHDSTGCRPRTRSSEAMQCAKPAPSSISLVRGGHHVTAAIHATPPVRRTVHVQSQVSRTAMVAVWYIERTGAATEPMTGGCAVPPTIGSGVVSSSWKRHALAH